MDFLVLTTVIHVAEEEEVVYNQGACTYRFHFLASNANLQKLIAAVPVCQLLIKGTENMNGMAKIYVRQ